jgi:hypothetical protein
VFFKNSHKKTILLGHTETVKKDFYTVSFFDSPMKYFFTGIFIHLELMIFKIPYTTTILSDTIPPEIKNI